MSKSLISMLKLALFLEPIPQDSPFQFTNYENVLENPTFQRMNSTSQMVTQNWKIYTNPVSNHVLKSSVESNPIAKKHNSFSY